MAEYNLRKASGICVRCGRKPAFEKQIHCIDCRDKASERQRKHYRVMKNRPGFKFESTARYHLLRSHGICARCGQKPAIEKRPYCIDCCEKQKAIDRKNYHIRNKRPGVSEALRVKVKTKRDDRKAAGLCTYCGKRVPALGRKKCDHCLAHLRFLYAKKHPPNTKNEKGLCCFCDSPALPGKRTCHRHYTSKLEHITRVNRMRMERQLAAKAHCELQLPGVMAANTHNVH